MRSRGLRLGERQVIFLETEWRGDRRHPAFFMFGPVFGAFSSLRTHPSQILGKTPWFVRTGSPPRAQRPTTRSVRPAVVPPLKLAEVLGEQGLHDADHPALPGLRPATLHGRVETRSSSPPFGSERSKRTMPFVRGGETRRWRDDPKKAGFSERGTVWGIVGMSEE